jgi:uncharacterized cupredoxin-like copper-binding protein
MTRFNRSVFMLLAALTLPTAASAATIVKIDLWDKGAAAEMATNLAYATPLPDVSKAVMGVKLSSDSVPAGTVTFEVTNASKDTPHEMIVMALATPGQPLPYSAKESRVDEDKAGDKGEVSELAPSKSGSLTVDLKPGKYLLICNVANHYMAGMWATFTVTE